MRAEGLSNDHDHLRAKGMNRKEFIGMSALAAVCGGCGTFNIGMARGRRPAPSDTLNLAVIGCGPMGAGNMKKFMNDPRVRVTHVCDPIAESSYHGYDAKTPHGRDVFKRRVDKFYSTTATKSVADFREVLADPSVDAVQISTGDYWHAPIGVAAMKAGKHVYCQKPMTLGISEGWAMIAAAKAHGVTFQVGSQQRSASEFRMAAEIIRNGLLGACKSCTIGLCYAHNDGQKQNYTRNCTPSPVPGWFSPKDAMWNLYQGPAEHWEDNAYIPAIHAPVCWRWSSRTGNGSIADWGAHHFDILQWALGTELSGPVAIENVKTDIFDPSVTNRYLDQAKKYQFDIVYANGFRAHVGDLETIGFNGLKFHGEKGNLFVTRGKIELPESLKQWKESDLKGSDARLYLNAHAKGVHEVDFVDAVYEGRQPACPVEIGHRSATICHLANIAARLGRTSLKWNPAAERIVGDAEASARIFVKHHNGWSV